MTSLRIPQCEVPPNVGDRGGFALAIANETRKGFARHDNHAHCRISCRDSVRMSDMQSIIDTLQPENVNRAAVGTAMQIASSGEPAQLIVTGARA